MLSIMVEKKDSHNHDEIVWYVDKPLPAIKGTLLDIVIDGEELAWFRREAPLLVYGDGLIERYYGFEAERILEFVRERSGQEAS